MAQYLTEVLQDKLDLSNINVNESRRLPSPEVLKGKVLVKVRFHIERNGEKSSNYEIISKIFWCLTVR